MSALCLLALLGLCSGLPAPDPIFRWPGRFFSGIAGDRVYGWEDLAQTNPANALIEFGGAMSISFKAKWQGSIVNHGAILSFDNGPSADNIVIQSLFTMPDLLFKVGQGTAATQYQAANRVITVGAYVRHLISVSATGDVQIWEADVASGANPLMLAQGVNVNLVPEKKTRSRLLVGVAPDSSGDVGLFHGDINDLIVWDRDITWNAMEEYLNPSTTPAPVVESRVNITLRVHTSNEVDAATMTGATVSMLVNGNWLTESALCTTAMMGQVIDKSYDLLSHWPEKVRITGQGTDAWGLRQIGLVVIDPLHDGSDVEREHIVLPPDDNMKYASTSRHWIHAAPGAPPVLGAQVYSVPVARCTALVGVAHSLIPSCAEGDSILHGSQCTTRCQTDYYASSTLTCVYGAFNPATFECNVRQCGVPAAPLNGALGTCLASAMASGTSCQPTCDSNYIDPPGPTTCYMGRLTEAQCVPKPCSTIAELPAKHSAIGTCPRESLASTHACDLLCSPGYQGGHVTCSMGVLTIQPCKIVLIVEVETSTVQFAETTTGANIVFHLDDNLQSVEQTYLMATSASVGEVVVKSFDLPDWPYALQLAGLGIDAWGVKDIRVRLDAATQSLLELGADPTTREQRYLLKYWVGVDLDAYPSLIFAVPPLHCSAISGIHNGGSLPTCEEGATVNHLSHCTTRCALGYAPSVERLSCLLDVLTPSIFSCGPAACKIVAPTNGDIGDCPVMLPSGSSCKYVCDQGHTLSVAQVYCSHGSLTTLTCNPDACDLSMLPDNGQLGFCPLALEHGASCQPTCNNKHVLQGAYTCDAGNLTQEAQCIPAGCAYSPPENSNRGSCNSVLASGQSCEPQCNNGYHLVGKTLCMNGDFMSLSHCAPNDCNLEMNSLNQLELAHGRRGNCSNLLLSGTKCHPACNTGFTRIGEMSCLLGELTYAHCLINFTINVTTSSLDYAKSAGAVDLSFEVEGQWLPDVQLARNVAMHENVLKQVYLRDWPTRTRLTPVGEDAWGLQQISVEANGVQTMVLNTAYEVPYSADSLYWVGQYSLDGGGARVYEVNFPECSIVHSATSGQSQHAACKDGLTTMAHRQSCETNCAEGYIGNVAELKCEMGLLVPSSYACNEKSCPLPDMPLHGQRGDCPLVLESNKTCSFKCDTGYVLSDIVSCKLGSATQPTCVPPSCTNIQPPQNGNMGECGGALATGQRCRPSCNTGYGLRGMTRCNFGIHVVAECLPLACEGIRLPTHMVASATTPTPAPTPAPAPAEAEEWQYCVEAQNLSSGTSCHFKCDAGYQASGLISCYLGEVADATCVPNSCNIPQQIEHGGRGGCGETLASGEQCSFSCSAGYYVSGVTSCSLGSLTAIGECLPKTCSISNTAPEQGSHVDCPAVLSSGLACDAKCNAGYVLGAVSRTSCMLGQTTLARCSPIPCTMPGPPTHGDVGDCASILQSGSSCQPKCDTGYTAGGRVSCNLGVLSPPTGMMTCTPSACRVFSITHGSTGDCTSIIASGSTCTPVCDDGYILSGLTSCYMGVTTSSTCIGIPCKSSTHPQNGTRGDCPEEILHGSSCQPTCNSGFKVSGVSRCVRGEFQAAVCIPPFGCEVSLLPDNSRSRGDCPRVLQAGKACEPECMPGYTASSYYCSVGTLQPATCFEEAGWLEDTAPYLLAIGSALIFFIVTAVVACIWRNRKSPPAPPIVQPDQSDEIARLSVLVDQHRNRTFELEQREAEWLRRQQLQVLDRQRIYDELPSPNTLDEAPPRIRQLDMHSLRSPGGPLRSPGGATSPPHFQSILPQGPGEVQYGGEQFRLVMPHDQEQIARPEDVFMTLDPSPTTRHHMERESPRQINESLYGRPQSSNFAYG